jgi:hypothetical protein
MAIEGGTPQRSDGKLQIPNTKLQKNSKHQASKAFGNQRASAEFAPDGAKAFPTAAALKVGIWGFSGAWCLGFGV